MAAFDTVISFVTVRLPGETSAAKATAATSAEHSRSRPCRCRRIDRRPLRVRPLDQIRGRGISEYALALVRHLRRFWFRHGGHRAGSKIIKDEAADGRRQIALVAV